MTCRSAGTHRSAGVLPLPPPASTTTSSSYAFAVSELAKSGLAREALHLFRRANAASIGTGNPTLFTVLRCCGEVSDLVLGSQVHAMMVKDGIFDCRFLSNALLSLYAKCGALGDARMVFEDMKDRDVVSSTSIVSALARNGEGSEGLAVLKRMMRGGVLPNCVTLVSALSGRTGHGLCLEEQGSMLHDLVVKCGLGFSSYVVSSLINFYAKCGEVDLAWAVFGLVDGKDSIVCNSMIADFSQNFRGHAAIELFKCMRRYELNLSSYTFGALFNACACLATVCVGRQIQSLSSKILSDQDLHVSCALVDMCSKCGCVDEARCVFDSVGEKNSVMWTSMIMGYAQHGKGEDGILAV